MPAKNSAPQKKKCKTRKNPAKENGDYTTPKSKNLAGSYLSDMESELSDDLNDDSVIDESVPRVSWTEEGKEAVFKHLSSFVRQRRFPGKRDCENCISKSNGALERRDWRAVKYVVKNQVDKRKRVLARKNS